MVKKVTARPRPPIMPAGKSKGGHKFQPGNQASKGKGRPRGNSTLKAVRNLNRAQVDQMVNDFLSLPIEKLKKIAENPLTLALEALVARIMIVGILTGDQSKLNYLLERLFGKLPDAPRDIRVHLEKMPPSQLMEAGRAAIAYLEAEIREADE